MRASLLLCVLLGLTVCSCLPKATGVQAPSPLDVAVVAVASYPDRPEVDGIPTALADALTETLDARNLQGELVPAADFTEVFTAKRHSQHRLSWLAEERSSADLVLLVEVEPRYFSLLSGRYRWTVHATMTLARPGATDEALSAEASFPMFMDFHHEREDKVLAASGPVLDRHLGHLLDEYLGGF